MKIRKFEGASELEVMEKVKAELGVDALILNIKKVQPRGIFAFFRRPLVEISAAYEDNSAKITPRENNQACETRSPEEMVGLSFLEQLGWKRGEVGEAEEKQKKGRQTDEEADQDSGIFEKPKPEEEEWNDSGKYKSKLVRRFYDLLVAQEVLPELAKLMLKDMEDFEDDDKIDINLMVKIVYNTITEIIGEPEVIDLGRAEPGKPLTVVLMGSTGVGKTTTIAKLSANFILKESARVSLITADTYRVAAVEQLKTYAEILGIETGVAYNIADLELYLRLFSEDSDIMLVDTAGRSHRNRDNMSELQEFLAVMPDSDRYLVLNLATRYEDLINIIDVYSGLGDFKIIFSKLDEAMKYGSIVNICYKTGRKISYVTTGQNVPDDLIILKPDIVAKALLGLGEII